VSCTPCSGSGGAQGGVMMSDEHGPIREHMVRAVFDAVQDPGLSDETTAEILW
jgi:hypothetical protein